MTIGKHWYLASLIVQILFLLIFYYEYVGRLENYSQHYLVWTMIVVGVNMSLHFIRIWYNSNKCNSNYKSQIHSIIFVIGYFFVFFQKYIDLLLGYTDVGDAVFVSEYLINKCSIISTIGFLAFLLGYEMFFKRSMQRSSMINTMEIDLKWMKFFLLVSTSMFVFFNYESMLFQKYSQKLLEAQAGTISLYSNILVQVSFILYISYVVHNASRKSFLGYLDYARYFGITSHLCLIVFGALFVLSGDRGPVIVVSLAYWGGYLYSVKKDMSWKWTTIFFVIGTLFFSTLGKTRSYDKTDGRINPFVQELFFEEDEQQNSISPYTLEYATSVKTLHHSVENVPNKYPYLYGSFLIRQILSVIPFSARLTSEFFDPHFKYRSSAFFITWLIQGDFYSYGSGSSCNADLYLNFGIWGVFLGLFLWGVIYGKLYSVIKRGNFSIRSIIVILYFLAYSLYVSRASLLSFLNFMCFTVILDAFYRYVFQKR